MFSKELKELLTKYQLDDQCQIVAHVLAEHLSLYLELLARTTNQTIWHNQGIELTDGGYQMAPMTKLMQIIQYLRDNPEARNTEVTKLFKTNAAYVSLARSYLRKGSAANPRNTYLSNPSVLKEKLKTLSVGEIALELGIGPAIVQRYVEDLEEQK